MRSPRPGRRRQPGPSHRTGGRPRRSRALLGLAASALLAAGAVVAWAAWSVPTPIKLTPSSSSNPKTTSAPKAPPKPHALPASQDPVAAAAPSGHRSASQVVTGATVSPPIALVIPAIDVTARIVPEGLGPGGTLDIPPPAQVGWYDRGPAPGQSGTTLLAGHIDDDRVPGALLHLNDVQTGATIRVTTASGPVAVYTVTQRRLLPQSELALSGLLSTQGAPALVLVSCGGAYDAATHLYLDNIVVVATPAG
ncbi:MAG: sortase [Actinobacteria bacterium]|nr:sortase [Actinomycetota bacterium]